MEHKVSIPPQKYYVLIEKTDILSTIYILIHLSLRG